MYSFAHKFAYPLQNAQTVYNWNKIKGIMKIACYFCYVVPEYVISHNRYLQISDVTLKWHDPYSGFVLCV